MISYEKKEITVCKRAPIEIKCDICKKVIVDKSMKPRYYYTLTTGHYEWGNDSCDSIEHKDICSDACLQIAFNEYTNNLVKEYDTAYFNVEREWGNIK